MWRCTAGTPRVAPRRGPARRERGNPGKRQARAVGAGRALSQRQPINDIANRIFTTSGSKEPGFLGAEQVVNISREDRVERVMGLTGGVGCSTA